MAFQEILRSVGGRPIATTVRAGVTARGIVSVSIPRDVWWELGRPERAKILVGAGPDAGKFLLAPTVRGGVRVAPNRVGAGVMRAIFGAGSAGLTATREPTREVPHEVTPDGLVITLPAEWFSPPETTLE